MNHATESNDVVVLGSASVVALPAQPPVAVAGLSPCTDFLGLQCVVGVPSTVVRLLLQQLLQLPHGS